MYISNFNLIRVCTWSSTRWTCHSGQTILYSHRWLQHTRTPTSSFLEFDSIVKCPTVSQLTMPWLLMKWYLSFYAECLAAVLSWNACSSLLASFSVGLFLLMIPITLTTTCTHLTVSASTHFRVNYWSSCEKPPPPSLCKDIVLTVLSSSFCIITYWLSTGTVPMISSL